MRALRSTALFLPIAAVLAQPGLCGPVHLTAQVIKAELPGSVLKLDTPLGAVVPISFGSDGFMTGDAGLTLGQMLGSAKDRGRWWVEGDRVCYKWFRWFDAKQHCVSIDRDGEKIFWTRDDGDTGTATLERHGPVHADQVAKSAAPGPAADTPKAAQAPKPVETPLVAAISNDHAKPVLVKLPTPAIRPQKKATVVVQAKSSLPAKTVASRATVDPHPAVAQADVARDEAAKGRPGVHESDWIIDALGPSQDASR